jgi:hypothetical protein|tara:strand:- start:344 stop:550 length:207 start_codon:yes stop_codon:yes gene_type:complete
MIGNKIDAQMEDCGEFITVNGVLHKIIKEHQYDDFGKTLDTFTLMNFAGDVIEIYSYDEGMTFVDEID